MSEGMSLTENEAKALAYRVAHRQIAETENWLEWEDYPELGEHAFARLEQEVRSTVGNYLYEALRQMEQVWGIDSAELREGASR